LHREAPKTPAKEAVIAKKMSKADLTASRERIEFIYPHTAAVLEPAKTSVSAIRNRMQSRDEETATPKRFTGSGTSVDGRSRGLASHAFLQHVDLSGSFDAKSLHAQAAEMARSGSLAVEDLKLIDWEAIATFWGSDVGLEIRRRAEQVRRELPFTFKLRNEDVTALGADLTEFAIPAGEFVVVQGVADLAMLGANEIWLIDFKTDAVNAKNLPTKVEEYRAQITLYAGALAGIYRKPVTRRGLYFLAARHLEWVE
jgi:ATP-dependent helicase/nuclease subunit A